MSSALVLIGLVFASAQQVTTLSSDSGIDDAMVLKDDGFLYGAQYTGSAVFRLSPDDWSSEEFASGFNSPNGMAFTSDGSLFMADQEGNRIYRILEDGTSEVFINNFYSPSGMIKEPDSDTLVVTSYYGNRIVKIAPDGAVLTITTNDLLNGPVGLCYDDDGQLYVGNFNNRRIIKIHDDGQQELLVQPSGGGWLGFITYAKGYIYGTLFSQHKIFRTDLLGNDTIFLGSGPGIMDGGPGEATFNGPNGIIASGSQDTLFVSDHHTRALRIITQLDEITTNSQAPVADIQWQVSPNPTIDQIRIEFQLEQSTSIDLQLIDGSGKLVQTITTPKIFSAGSHIIPVAVDHLSQGLYFVRIRAEERAVFNRAFIKS